MSHAKSREVVLAIETTAEVLAKLDELRRRWMQDAHSLPKGLSCSASKEGQFVITAAESAFVTVPGACVIAGIGAIRLLGEGPMFEEGAGSKTLVLRHTDAGWKFSVKFVPPIVRERNMR
ncbi:MAG TPA: hypothetical protein VJ001_03400 [Rhodocyclaceae bacterium]|nr:hypothetical protein [Rhodocyclaceae bacterium]